MDRRNFISRFARGGLLASLAALTGTLIYRDQVTKQADCSGNFQCRSCSKLKGCELEEAAKERDHGEKG